MILKLIYPRWPKLERQTEFHLPPHGPVCFAAALPPEVEVSFVDEHVDPLVTDDNPDMAREVLGTYTNIDPAVAEAAVLPRWPGEINRESVQLLADLAVSDGLISAVPDLDALLP